MSDTPSAISGYRKLSDEEMRLVNDVKRTEAEWLKRIDDLRARQARLDESEGTDDPEPFRWLSIAKTQVELAAMSLTRAITKPVPYVPPDQVS